MQEALEEVRKEEERLRAEAEAKAKAEEEAEEARLEKVFIFGRFFFNLKIKKF